MNPRHETADRLDALLGVEISADSRELQLAVRNILDREVRPHLTDWYERGEVPVRKLARVFGELGVLGMHLSGYGCAGSSALDYGLACLELEAADSGIRSLVSVQGSLAMYAIHRFGSEEQKNTWLPGMAAGELIGCFGLTEPDRGSDPGDMRTRAVRHGDGWRINGAKMWITNAPIADVAVVWARTDEGIRGFVVPTDTPGLTRPEIRSKLSLRASVTGELVLADVDLPDDALLPLAQGLSAPLACLNEARFGIVFGAVGSARECLAAAIDYAGAREQFDRPISAFQLTQAKLAQMATGHGTSLLVAIQLAALKDAGTIQPHQVSFGKRHNVRAALEIAREARTILGANGISGEYAPMRHANNLESVLTYEGTEEIHTLVIGQKLTGIAAFR